jgi:signal transduction histidine kinase
MPWLSLAPLAVAAAATVAGTWGIVLARRGATEEASRHFAAETAARARALEGLLSDIRADLAFVAASSPLSALAAEGDVPAEAARRREAAESLLLVFLRSHPQVVRLALRSGDGAPLLLMGRRGGIPVLWVSKAPTGEEGAATDPRVPRMRSSVTMDGEDGRSLSLEAEVTPSLLVEVGEAADPRCRFQDGDGRLLAGVAAGSGDPGPGRLQGSSAVQLEGWSVPGPGALACTGPDPLASGLLQPLAARYRSTLALNLAALVLTVLLGALAVREVARRERLEAQTREDARVRDVERQLFHAERLTTLGQLAAGIAHEINNPLEGMANYLALAREELAAGRAEAAAARLDGVQVGLERAAAIVRQVLAHAEPGQAARTPVDVNGVVREAVDFIRSRREFGRVAFGLELAEAPLLALASPTMIGQVASNLVINACEAQPGGGEVLVRSARDGDRVVIDVADRGPGIPESDRERVFEPFFSTKSSTGLGLSVCHAIARQHDGELTVRAREGGGAVFRLTLPAVTGVAA